jgi:hypothetical protein
MKKTARSIIALLLIPSFIFANNAAAKINAMGGWKNYLSPQPKTLSTEFVQKTITYVENKIGKIDTAHIKYFTLLANDFYFLPVKAGNNIFSTLFYWKKTDGKEFAFLLTYDRFKKAVSYEFPNGRTYLVSLSGIKQFFNSDFNFQPVHIEMGPLYGIFAIPFLISGAVALVFVFPIFSVFSLFIDLTYNDFFEWLAAGAAVVYCLPLLLLLNGDHGPSFYAFLLYWYGAAVALLLSELLLILPSVPSDTDKANTAYSDVWGSSSQDVFAVGSIQINTSEEYKGVIEHFDGSSWSPMEIDIDDKLISVWGSSGSDVFAIGYSGAILHYDGSAWSTMKTSPPYTYFKDIWGSSGSNVFVTGTAYNPENYRYSAILLHFDGSTWSSMPTALIGQDTFISSIWGSADTDIYAISSYNSESGHHDVIQHYDGKSWSIRENPAVDDECEMCSVCYSLAGNSGNNIYAACEMGFYHYDGGIWEQIPDSLGSSNPSPNAVWVSAAGLVIAVREGYIDKLSGNEWTRMKKISSYLNGVWGTSDTDIFAVGGNKTILHYNGIRWRNMSN